MDTPQSVELTRSERELLLNIRHITPEVEKKIVSSRITGNRFHIEFTPAELEGLMAGLASEVNYTDDRTMARAYEELRQKLEKLEEEASRGGRPMPGASDILILLGLVAAVALLALVMVVALWLVDRRRAQARIEQLLQEQDRNLTEARRDSVQKSRSTLKGQIAEQMAPLLPGFRYRPADARFLGDPIDYVVFSGYTDVRDSGSDSSSLDIVLLEVKQGTSSLSPFQRAIARSVQEGRVRFEILRISESGVLSSETWQPRRAAGSGPRA